jgi:hypothetical protein
MKSRIKNLIAEAAVWTLLAAYVEVATTATVERLSLGDRYALRDVPFMSLQGHTTVWCMIDGALFTVGIRGMIALLDRLGQRERVFARWWAQSMLVMMAIYMGELAAGLFFNKMLGWKLWDYSQYEWRGVPLHLWGQITLVYAPAWFLAGLLLRPVYRAVHAIAPYVSLTTTAVVEGREMGAAAPPLAGG